MCFNMTLHAKLLGNHLFFTNRDSRKTNSVCGKPPPCFRFRKRRVWIVIRCRVSPVCISSSGLVLSHIDWKIVPFDPPPLHIVWNMWDVNTNYPNNLFIQCLRISSMFFFWNILRFELWNKHWCYHLRFSPPSHEADDIPARRCWTVHHLHIKSSGITDWCRPMERRFL